MKRMREDTIPGVKGSKYIKPAFLKACAVAGIDANQDEVECEFLDDASESVSGFDEYFVGTTVHIKREQELKLKATFTRLIRNGMNAKIRWCCDSYTQQTGFVVMDLDTALDRYNESEKTNRKRMRESLDDLDHLIDEAIDNICELCPPDNDNDAETVASEAAYDILEQIGEEDEDLYSEIMNSIYGIIKAKLKL